MHLTRMLMVAKHRHPEGHDRDMLFRLLVVEGPLVASWWWHQESESSRGSMNMGTRWGWVVPLALLTGCTAAGDEEDDSAKCIAFLQIEDQTYFPRAAKSFPAAGRTLVGDLPQCDDRGVRDTVKPLEVTVIEGIDAAIAVGEEAAKADMHGTIWVAIGETPEHDIPSEVVRYLAP